MKEFTTSGVNFPLTFNTRISELINSFEYTSLFKQSLDAFLFEMNYRYGAASSPYTNDNFWPSVRDEFNKVYNQVKKQPGYSLSVFFFLEDLWLNVKKSNETFQKLTLNEFLQLDNQLLFPLKLIRPGEVYLEDVKDKRYLSCLYILNNQHKIIVSPFVENEIHKVWFNRIKHSTLANFQNVFACGVMYFCPSTKELLFVNNASGHYRIKEAESCLNLIKPLSQLKIQFNNARYSNYDDVEFNKSHPLV